eukprot:1609851-Amphidinium_carterae.1
MGCQLSSHVLWFVLLIFEVGHPSQHPYDSLRSVHSCNAPHTKCCRGSLVGMSSPDLAKTVCKRLELQTLLLESLVTMGLACEML